MIQAPPFFGFPVGMNRCKYFAFASKEQDTIYVKNNNYSINVAYIGNGGTEENLQRRYLVLPKYQVFPVRITFSIPPFTELILLSEDENIASLEALMYSDSAITNWICDAYLDNKSGVVQLDSVGESEPIENLIQDLHYEIITTKDRYDEIVKKHNISTAGLKFFSPTLYATFSKMNTAKTVELSFYKNNEHLSDTPSYPLDYLFLQMDQSPFNGKKYECSGNYKVIIKGENTLALNFDIFDKVGSLTFNKK